MSAIGQTYLGSVRGRVSRETARSNATALDGGEVLVLVLIGRHNPSAIVAVIDKTTALLCLI